MVLACSHHLDCIGLFTEYNKYVYMYIIVLYQTIQPLVYYSGRLKRVYNQPCSTG